ncbi:hypothetical protein [Thiocapsa roseopersicina]|uniref:Uncharacterized protein n=1 Tax=Thiocapsa roseopersicina TaxID=1058 RepID=A0A1H2VNE8_THIRO|nr:hypothetical protein [Thiocapsa roseopersicina]SDW69882.1 hypothetical protein SAMN05421783_107100 [Thiocapsa roseopersicina]
MNTLQCTRQAGANVYSAQWMNAGDAAERLNRRGNEEPMTPANQQVL